MMWNGYGMSGWGMALMMLSQIIVWALLIGGGVYLVRTLTGKPGPADSSQLAAQILAERYARGEIDEDEYKRRLTTLRQSQVK